MKKKAALILLVILLLTGGGYVFIRYSVLRSPDFRPQAAIARSPLDLRPALVAKLQQMVFDGSDGLYRLTLEDIQPDLSASTVDLLNAHVSVDTARLEALDKMQSAPDDVYEFSFRRLHIAGLGLSELINSRKIDLDKITVSNPRLTVYQKKRKYNADRRPLQDSLTLYERLTKYADHISVKEIRMDNGVYINVHPSDKNKNTRFEGLNAVLKNILVDSSTRIDRSRFLFASDASVSCGKLQRFTNDGLYTIKTDGVTLNATAHQLTVRNAALLPRGDRAYFQARQKYRGDRFQLTIPRIECRKIKWNELFNGGSFESAVVDVYNARLTDYVNDALPPRPLTNKANFPYQLFRAVSAPITINQVNLHDCNITYTEFYPPSGREGTLRFNDVNARLTNVINDPKHISQGMWCRVNSSCLFLGKIPLRVQFAFNMNAKNGQFTADLHAPATEGTELNIVTEPLGLFMIKNGTLDALDTHLTGDNDVANAQMTMLYHGLHISPLKKKEDGELKKKHVLGLIANVLAIKNDNPSGNETRSPQVSVNRDKTTSFFNFGWRAIRLAVFKTVGVPERFAPN